MTLVPLTLWHGLLLPVWDAYSVAGMKKFILHVDGECRWFWLRCTSSLQFSGGSCQWWHHTQSVYKYTMWT